MFFRQRISRYLLMNHYALFRNLSRKTSSETFKTLHFTFDVVSQDMCRGSSAWESARLKTESSHVQTLPSAPNNLNLRLFCNIGHKLQRYLRSARRIMRYERRNAHSARLSTIDSFYCFKAQSGFEG